MQRATKMVLIVVRVIAGITVPGTLPACTIPADETAASAQLAATPPAASRRQLDDQLEAWLTTRKDLPDTPGVAGCVADQLHVQALSDDGARTLVAALYAVGPGSDPALGALPTPDRTRLARATWLCGTTLPGLPS